MDTLRLPSSPLCTRTHNASPLTFEYYIASMANNGGRPGNLNNAATFVLRLLSLMVTGFVSFAGALKGGLFLFGFGPGGVLAGSLAAIWHSTIGNVAAGSLFAILQSIGAGGVLALPVYLAVGAVGAVVFAFKWARGGEGPPPPPPPPQSSSSLSGGAAAAGVVVAVVGRGGDGENKNDDGDDGSNGTSEPRTE